MNGVGGARDTTARGAIAESAAAEYLSVTGYEIVARNVRVGSLEVDLVARKDDVLAVVEVRGRKAGAVQGAIASFTPRKAACVRKAVARLWRSAWSTWPGVRRVRIDVAAVTFDGPSTRIEHIEGVLA